jgi:hypothetical protein
MESFRSRAIRAAANQSDLIQGLGRISSLEIDAKQAKIFVSILFHGEAEPIQAVIGYQLLQDTQTRTIEIQSVECSRAWLQQLYRLYVEKKGPVRLPLVGSLGTMISMIL